MNVTGDEAYAAGRSAGEAALQRSPTLLPWQARMEDDFRWARASYLGAAELDLAEALLEFSRERLASGLDLRRCPECRGLRRLVEAERRGFRDACPDPLALAHHFDWGWFVSRRLNTRFVGKPVGGASLPRDVGCTDFWFADTAEGGPIHGCNRDDVLFRYKRGFAPPPKAGPPDKPYPLPGSGLTCIGGASAAVLCDDEPECLFPVRLDWVRPPEIKTLEEFVPFMERYRDFWGPGNSLWIDESWTFAAIEKANVRMGVRRSQGWAAITACAYLTPDMNAFKKERDRRSFAARGWGEDCVDAAFWSGCERRYRRLMELVQVEHRRGATAVGAARIALDHDAPFPDRICLAGERGHPDEKLTNWTLLSFARCVSGPNRRILYWVIDPTHPEPVYTTPCHVVPGVGLEARKAAWQHEAHDAGFSVAGLRRPGPPLLLGPGPG